MASKALTKNNAWKAWHRQCRYYSAPTDGTIPAAKQQFVPSKGTYPKGFLAGSAHVGVKASNTRFDDLAVVTSQTPCTASATFTQNLYCAAPVNVSRQLLTTRQNQGFRGVVVNSGCANAVTGKGGREDAGAMVKTVDEALATRYPFIDEGSSGQSLVMSTGVIGQRLPISKILNKIPQAVSSLGESHEHWMAAARAICTTDTFPKLVSRTFTLPSHPGVQFGIAGMTKGAGMIHPNMATLLGIICTDAPIHHTAIGPLLSAAVSKSFNCISIDGDTSTNDTVALFANGAAVSSSQDTPTIRQDHTASAADYSAFETELTALATDLAKLIVRDGEGATKFVEISVQNASSNDLAHRVASRIAISPLVKTALYGKDANWGRILCATGNTAQLAPGDADIDPSLTSVSFVPAGGSAKDDDRLWLLRRGEPQNVDEALAAEYLQQGDLVIEVDLGDTSKGGSAKFWTCDFSHEYVTINGDYRT